MESKYDLTNGRSLVIEQDEYPQNPRKDWEPLGTFAGGHRRYDIFDVKIEDVYDLAREVAKTCGQKDAHFLNRALEDERIGKEAMLKKIEDVAVLLPVYMYDHSGITIATTPFSCPWDSGIVGWIFLANDKIRKEYGVKNITKKTVDRMRWYLNGEIKVLDAYVRGAVYGYKILNKEGEEEDACWGFFGDNILLNGILGALSDEDEKLVRKESSKWALLEEKSEREARRRFRSHKRRLA